MCRSTTERAIEEFASGDLHKSTPGTWIYRPGKQLEGCLWMQVNLYDVKGDRVAEALIKPDVAVAAAYEKAKP